MHCNADSNACTACIHYSLSNLPYLYRSSIIPYSVCTGARLHGRHKLLET